MELEHGPRLAADLVLGVRLAQERQGRAVGAGRGLDHVRHESLLAFLVEVAQVLAAELHVLVEVVIAPVSDPLQLADAEGERVLDVGRRRRVERQLLGIVVAQPEPSRLQAEVHVPLEPRLPPVRVPLLRLVGTAEELDLHLLELARAEGEVPRD